MKRNEKFYLFILISKLCRLFNEFICLPSSLAPSSGSSFKLNTLNKQRNDYLTQQKVPNGLEEGTYISPLSEQGLQRTSQLCYL